MKQDDVLLVSNMYPSRQFPEYGIFVYNAEQELRKSGITVSRSVISGKRQPAIVKLLAYLQFIVTGAYKILRQRGSLVYLHYIAHSSMPFLLASLFCKRNLVAHVHGGDVIREAHQQGRLSGLWEYFAEKLIRKAQLVIVPSEYYADVVKSKYSGLTAEVMVSPSGGVDTHRFSPSENAHPYKQDGLLKLGYVGRLDPGKGVETLLDAVSAFPELQIPFSLILVGDGELRPELEARCKKLGISEQVNFVGRVSHDQLPGYYRQMDFMLFPTQREAESLGLVGVEALACGTPVIASDVAGPKTYVVNGQNGFLVKPGDAGALIDCFSKVIMNMTSDDYQQMSEVAVSSVKHFDSEQVSQTLVAKFKSKFTL